MKTKPRILIVDDDDALRKVLHLLLEAEGFAVLEAASGEEGLRLAGSTSVDLILLDIMMPEMDGRQICQRLRETSTVPIIMLTCISSEREKVERLNQGADDYVTKPYRNDELIARIRAILRRTRRDPESVGRVYDDGFLRFNLDLRQVYVENQLVNLAPKQWHLFECLVKNHRCTLSHETLLRTVWGAEYLNAISYLKVQISHLRDKLHESAHASRYIHTVRDQGYRFAPPDK